MIVFERAGLLCIFNFNPTESFVDFRVGVDEPGTYQVVLSTDEDRFGGFERISKETKHFTTPMEWNGRRNLCVLPACHLAISRNLTLFPSRPTHHSLQVYTPSHTAMILAKVV